MGRWALTGYELSGSSLARSLWIADYVIVGLEFQRYRDVETKEVVAVKRIDPGTPMDVDAVEKYLKDLKAKPHDHVVRSILSFPVLSGY